MWKRKPPPPTADADGYYDIMPASDLLPDQCHPITCHDTPLILTRIKGVPIAFYRYCPHAAGDFAKGEIRRGRIDCPDHNYRFDLTTGRILYPEDEAYRLRRYPVKEEAGRIKVKL